MLYKIKYSAEFQHFVRYTSLALDHSSENCLSVMSQRALTYCVFQAHCVRLVRNKKNKTRKDQNSCSIN